MDEELWRIGELAARTGLTVRALRHYEALGLLRPVRNQAGHRRYGEADVRTLYAIVALRKLAVPLGDIAACLGAPGFDMRALVRRQLEEVNHELEARKALRGRLEQVLVALHGDTEPSAQAVIQVLEAIAMTERYYTPGQLAALEVRREALGAEAIQRVEHEWAALIAEVEAERERGTDPADARVQALARRWHGLVVQFTGNDPNIRASLQRMYAEEGVEHASRGMLSAETMEYIARAMPPAERT